MTVQQLRELLRDAPDDMGVYLLGDSALASGFVFIPACIGESGIIDLPPDDIEEPTNDFPVEKQIFVLMPHGATATEEQLDEMGDQPIPEIEN